MGKETNLLCRTSSEFHRYSAVKKAEHKCQCRATPPKWYSIQRGKRKMSQ